MSFDWIPNTLPQSDTVNRNYKISKKDFYILNHCWKTPTGIRWDLNWVLRSRWMIFRFAEKKRSDLDIGKQVWIKTHYQVLFLIFYPNSKMTCGLMLDLCMYSKHNGTLLSLMLNHDFLTLLSSRIPPTFLSL